MDGIHDLGGKHGYGTVDLESGAPVFHERWEGRVFGILGQVGPGDGNIDRFRHALEVLDPITYLRNGYYGRWLAALERQLLDERLIEPGELEARMRGDATRAAPIDRPAMPAPRAGPLFVRAVGRRARFATGQRVVTRNHQPSGHTRLPAYARCRRGEISHVHPAMVYPDSNAHGRGEDPHYLYTVGFDGHELWGSASEPGTRVYIDLFEPYLDFDPAGGDT